jgi:CheY-like chemotaxis protein
MTPYRVLLADDGLVHQAAITGLLAHQGHHVTVAQNGLEAVDRLSSGQFDIVLMDVEMPVMDGLTATRLIRESEAGGQERVPIIAVTTEVNSDLCLEAGMDACLEKPVAPKLLDATLRWAMGTGPVEPEQP